MDDPTLKWSLHYLVDILACIPRLLEESDMLQSSQRVPCSADAGELDMYRSRLINVLSELFLWRWRWEQSNPAAAFEVPYTSTTKMTADRQSDTIFQTMLSYRHFHRGREPMLYNTALLLIFDLTEVWNVTEAPQLALAQLSEYARPLRSNPLTLPHEDLSSSEAIDEICRSLEYYLERPRSGAGAMVVLLPLRVTYRYVQEERRRSWLANVMEGISTSCGFGFSERLVNIENMAID